MKVLVLLLICSLALCNARSQIEPISDEVTIAIPAEPPKQELQEPVSDSSDASDASDITDDSDTNDPSDSSDLSDSDVINTRPNTEESLEAPNDPHRGHHWHPRRHWRHHHPRHPHPHPHPYPHHRWHHRRPHTFEDAKDASQLTTSDSSDSSDSDAVNSQSNSQEFLESSNDFQPRHHWHHPHHHPHPHHPRWHHRRPHQSDGSNDASQPFPSDAGVVNTEPSMGEAVGSPPNFQGRHHWPYPNGHHYPHPHHHPHRGHHGRRHHRGSEGFNSIPGSIPGRFGEVEAVRASLEDNKLFEGVQSSGNYRHPTPGRPNFDYQGKQRRSDRKEKRSGFGRHLKSIKKFFSKAKDYVAGLFNW